MKVILEQFVGQGRTVTKEVEPGYVVTITNNSASAKKFRVVQVRGRGRPPVKEKEYDERADKEVGPEGAGVSPTDDGQRPGGGV